MRTVVLGERPPELEDLIRRRRELGQDGFDEVWQGEYHVAPNAHSSHGIVAGEITAALRGAARRRGLLLSGPFNLGDPQDFRVPDGGFHRSAPGTLYVPTAAVVVEVLSPDDETFRKFDFFAAHGVEEVLVASPAERWVRCWHRTDGAYAEQDVSAVLGVSMVELVAEVAWP